MLVATSAWTSTSRGRWPSINGTTAEPGTPSAAIGQEQAARVGDADQPGLGHLEQAELARGAEPVLDRPQQPQRVVPIALEGEHRVDHVLEHARAGQATLLGDVADEQDGDAALAWPPARAGGHTRAPG